MSVLTRICRLTILVLAAACTTTARHDSWREQPEGEPERHGDELSHDAQSGEQDDAMSWRQDEAVVAPDLAVLAYSISPRVLPPGVRTRQSRLPRFDGCACSTYRNENSCVRLVGLPDIEVIPASASTSVGQPVTLTFDATQICMGHSATVKAATIHWSELLAGDLVDTYGQATAVYTQAGLYIVTLEMKVECLDAKYKLLGGGLCRSTCDIRQDVLISVRP